MSELDDRRALSHAAAQSLRQASCRFQSFDFTCYSLQISPERFVG
jgi:hypothetical protein